MRLTFCFVALAVLAAAQPLPVSTPEKEGLSSERLERLHQRFDQMAREGTRAGAITMIVRNGKIVDWRAYGQRDIAAKLPMEKDTICRIWSMSKVVTSVAAMMLVEEGKLTLSDPVHKYVPEFKAMKVLKGGTADAPVLMDATRPVTIKHLLTHTSGLTYSWGDHPVAEMYRRAKIFVVDSLQGFITKLAAIPLIAEPGEKYVITRYRASGSNLRTQLCRIIRRAGIEPWANVWHNLRRTRQTELEDTFPGHVVSAWLGNTEDTAREHYLMVRDEHFTRALHSALHYLHPQASMDVYESRQNRDNDPDRRDWTNIDNTERARRESNPQPPDPKSGALSN